MKREAFVGIYGTKTADSKILFALATWVKDEFNLDIRNIVGEYFDGAQEK